MNNSTLKINLKLIIDEVKKSLLKNNEYLVNNVFENTKGNEKTTFDELKITNNNLNDLRAIIVNQNKINKIVFNSNDNLVELNISFLKNKSDNNILD